MKRLVISICLALLTTTNAYSWSLFGPKNYEDCVIDGMKGVTSDVAAKEIKQACRKKFPIKERKLTKKEIEKMQVTLEFYTKHGLTPAKILEISEKRPVDLKVSAFSGPNPKAPGKLRKPLLDPSRVNPANLTPVTKSKLKENK